MHRLLGLGVVTIYLLSNRPIFYEHDLRPEAITPFFAILNILLTLIFFERRQEEGPSNSLAVITSLLMVNSVLLATLKTSFMLTVFFSIVPVLVALADRREHWRRRATVLAVGLIATLAVILPERALAKTDRSVQTFMPESLFTIHANLIARQIDEDVERGQCGPNGCEWLSEFARRLREEMVKSWADDQHYKSFGFNPDYLMYKNSLSTFTPRFFGGDYDKQLEFYRHYYWRTLRQHPERMLAKVVSQMGVFYSFGSREMAPRDAMRLAFFYQRTVFSLAVHKTESGASYPPYEKYLAKCRKASSSRGRIIPSSTIRFLNSLSAHLYLGILIGVLGVIASFPLAKQIRERYGRFAFTSLFLFSYNFGNCLGTATVHSLHIVRYGVAQYSFTLLSECAGLLLLLDLALHVFVNERSGRLRGANLRRCSQRLRRRRSLHVDPS